MTIEADFRTLALTTPALQTNLGTRLYPELLPEDPTLPAGTLSYVDGGAQLAHDGEDGLLWARLQLDFYATTSLLAQQLRDAARAWLNGFTGYVGSTEFLSVRLALALGGYEPATQRYRRTMDFMVQYKES